MATSNAEYCRKYRNRKKGNNVKQIAVSDAERMRMLRWRKKIEAGIVTSSSKYDSIGRFVEKKTSWFLNYFEKNFNNISLDAICDVCDRVWWSSDIVPNNKVTVKNILLNHDYDVKDVYVLCKTCNSSLNKNKLPSYATYNGFVYPPIPAHLPELDPIAERLISPRLPFLRIQQIGFYTFTKKLIGQIINVPIDINEIVTLLPRNDDLTINVHIKKRLFFKSSFYSGYIRRGVVKEWLDYLINTQLYKDHNIKIDEQFFADYDDATSFYEENEFLFNASTNSIDRDLEEAIDANNLLSMMQETVLLDESMYLELAPGEGKQPIALSFDEDAEELSFPSIYYGVPRRYKIHVTPFMMTSSELRRRDRRGVIPEKILYAAAKIMRLRVIQGFRLLFRNNNNVDISSITKQQIFDPAFVNDTLNRNLSFMESVPNSMQYWSKRKKDLLAMLRQLGKPTIFLTLSSSEVRWPKLLKTLLLAQCATENANDVRNMSDDELLSMSASAKTELVNKDPVICNLYFSKLVDVLMAALHNEKGPFGKYKIKDYFKRIEFQHRGSAHAHILLWLDNAPQETPSEYMPLTITMIDDLITTDSCALISHTGFPFQTHKHTFTCFKNKNQKECRFDLPKLPMRKTTILYPVIEKDAALISRYKQIRASINSRYEEDRPYKSMEEFFFENTIEDEDEYFAILRNGINRGTVFLRRNVEDWMTNAFNPEISFVLQSNMDIQFILDEYACAGYVAEYVNKSERGFSALHREIIKIRDEFPDRDYEYLIKEIGKRALNRVEMSSQEASWFLLRLPMSYTSRQVRFIHTQHPSERYITRKSRKQVARENLSDNSTDIWCLTDIQRYEMRPLEMVDVCLADFVANYSWKEKFDEYEDKDDDDNYVNCDDDDIEETEQPFIRNLSICKRLRSRIIRYVKYDMETDFLNYKRECVTLFLPFRNEELDILNGDAYIHLFDEHITHIFSKKQEYEMGMDVEKMLQLARTMKIEYESDNNNVSESQQILATDMENYDDCSINLNADNSDFKHITGISRIKQFTHIKRFDEYCEWMRKLNENQLSIVLDIIYRLIYNSNGDPLQIFFTGAAGTGKTYTLKVIMETINRNVLKHNSQSNAYIVCGSTGKAAVNIDGQTIHSAFNISVRKDHRNLSAEKLQTLRCDFRDIVFVIIDEISMCGYETLATVDKRLRAIGKLREPYGGYHVILCGDLRQLDPVKAKPAYIRPANLLEISMPWHNLSFFKLDQVMRQEDQFFSKLVTKIGDAEQFTKREKQAIESRFFLEEDLEHLRDVVRLFHSNAEVDAYNSRILDFNDCIIHEAVDTIMGVGMYTPTDESIHSMKLKLNKMNVSESGNMCAKLRLVLGCPYMITYNLNTEDRLVNGSVGYLRYIQYYTGETTHNIKRLWLEMEDDRAGQQIRERFRQNAIEWGLSQRWTPISQREIPISTKSKLLKVRRCQFPIVPACAITIHKSQGQTFNRIVYGYKSSHTTQVVYVAISRVKSLDGLFLISMDNKTEFSHAFPRNQLRALKTEYQRLESKKLRTIVDIGKDFILSCNIHFAYFNIQSLSAHCADIIIDPILRSSSLFAISETWMDNEKPSVIIQGFKCIHRNKRAGKTGGVALYESLTNSNLHSIEIISNDNFISEYGDICCVILKFEDIKFALICIYASVRNSIHNLKCLMDTALMPFHQNNSNLLISREHELSTCPIVLCGDLNANLKTCIGKELYSYVQQTYGMTSALDESISTTRNNTYIDYILIRKVENFRTFPYVSYFSVHRPILCGFNDQISTSSFNNSI